ncbi:NACHT, LRR and PYD domains-containing protein 1b allele 3-like [Poecilia formosa]|uniref:NACHT, LRR and PYD domains-containing protein 1b allele 3-like n=1 Tax=Poecilia formosa TaxID=48698 RepID=UPI000443CBAC|nr:PREDICTED: NACHT, LRR and PYD domains-containing protein 1b allele 3-like [Poecilia formosa]
MLTPASFLQLLTTDSSEEETSSCSMDLNVSPSSDPTQSDSDPNRSASTDHLLPSGSGLRRRGRSNSSPSLLCSLVHQDPPLDVSILPRAASLPTMKLQSSFEEFTPGFCGDPDDETCWFQCSGPGRYQCRVSGLVFDMTGGGDVFYRVVPWNRSLLGPHGKKPAGPLFDISCQQRSVARLHLPHCEVRSTGRCHFLSVAHLHDEGVEFIRPERITETHIVISITGFSAFGNVKDEDSPPDPVRALVLLFYRPPADPDVTSFLNVLLLPRNIVIRDLKRSRKKLSEDELFIDVPPHCKLHPDQVYTLSTSPENESVKVQPKEAEFDGEHYKDYFPSFQVTLKTLIRDIHLNLVEKSSSSCVWERDVHLLPAKMKTQLLSSEQLKEIRSSIIDRISGPNLKSLLDKLQLKGMMTEPESEEAGEMKSRHDKAQFIIDTVWRKDGASEMIEILIDIDPFLCKKLKLI